MKKQSLVALLLVLAIVLTSAAPCSAQPWKEEFERLCGQAEGAGSLPTDELRKIVADCDKLLETLQQIDTADKKVYIFRLKKCRNFYQYTIEMKER